MENLNSPDFLSEANQFLLQTRLTAVQDSIKRTRLALFFCTMASLASLICIWNTALSVDRLSGFRIIPIKLDNVGVCPGVLTDTPKSDPPPKGSPNFPDYRPQSWQYEKKDTACIPNTLSGLYKQISDHYVERWMSSTYITIPLLGISVSVTDFSIYNSCAMIFLAIYLMLAARRENRELGTLLIGLKDDLYLDRLKEDVYPDKSTRDLHKYAVLRTVYRAVCSFMVFNIPKHNDRPISTLQGIRRDGIVPPGTKAFASSEVFDWAEDVRSNLFKRKAFKIPIAGPVLKFLVELFFFDTLLCIFVVGIPTVWKTLKELFANQRDDSSNRTVFGLRQLIDLIFLMPAFSIAANLAYHLVLIRQSGFPWKIHSLSVLLFPIEAFEVIALRFALHLCWYILWFHYSTGQLVRDFDVYSSGFKPFNTEDAPPPAQDFQI